METSETGAQANENLQDSSSTGAQATEYDMELLDYEPEEEEEVLSISRTLERNGDQAKKYSKIRRGVPRCDICSNKHLVGYDTLAIHHNHYSSRLSENFSNHSQARLKICVTDLALHEQWEEDMIRNIGGDFQVEWISIPGARLSELMAAWEVEYRDEIRPMDVMVIGGVNNVAKGSPGPYILSSMHHFVDLVYLQGDRIHPSHPNTCLIATMSYPPSICWFEDDGPVPHNFVNHLRNMRWLNQRIELLNHELGLKAPNFPTLGSRKETRFGQSATRHRFRQWQGANRRDKMVPSAEIQKKMCKQISKYFLHNTGNNGPSQ